METSSIEVKFSFLRHVIATLAYRGAKVVRGTPAGFGAFRACEGSRSAGEILAHIGDLLDWTASFLSGKGVWHNSVPLAWDQETDRFFARLAAVDQALDSPPNSQLPAEKLFQGPLADALTHIGQIAQLRRMADAPVKGENYVLADIEAGRVGPDQSPPRREF
jgi:hypothetical protein